MRVLMVAFHYAPARDGLSRQTHLLARTLVRQGVKVSTITQRYPGTEQAEVRDGVEVVRLPVPPFGGFRTRAFPFMAGLATFMLRHAREFDVIHAHQALQPAALAVAMARVFKKPSIVKVAGGGHTGNMAYLSRWQLSGGLSLRALRVATRVVSLSSEITEELHQQGFSERQIIELPNGVDLARFATTAGQREPVRTVVTAARLSHEKGIDLLLSAWARVAERHPGVKLVILGDGVARSALEAQAVRLGLAGVVQFAGEVDDVIPYLRSSSVFVLPSHFGEGMSNALLEAMAAGCTIVTSDIAPNSALVKNEVNGLTFRSRDAKDLAAQVARCLADSALASRLGTRAAKDAQDYSIDQVARRYRELYEEVCG